ncbi:MAG: carboxy-S-adenosyl-L-methionine synthase CmoA [Candidatus Margulisbacteria bacterium]|nr:carboxy-S-adenosyl-L-methionine synthase CmoA [Candidatus Margulisiibacteriota bacterium]
MMKEKMKDVIYKKKIQQVPTFTFNRKTALAFDDMAKRSIPFYSQIQDMIVGLSQSIVQPHTSIYDFGCATGETLRCLCDAISDRTIHFSGIDSSRDMLRLASRQSHLYSDHSLTFGCHDLNRPMSIKNTSVAILNLTLQFINPSNRLPLLQSIHKGICPSGGLILIEKIHPENEHLTPLYTHLYHSFKKDQHYSDLEISQKKKALETVLIPLSASDNLTLLKKSGFTITECFFQWYNFAGFIAIKS